jgi:hypothetical protein
VVALTVTPVEMVDQDATGSLRLDGFVVPPDHRLGYDTASSAGATNRADATSDDGATSTVMGDAVTATSTAPAGSTEATGSNSGSSSGDGDGDGSGVDGDGGNGGDGGGAGASGGDLVEWLRTTATIGRCALQLGVLEQALAMTAEHARTRVQFDRPIATFQAVAQRLADAYVDVEAVRLTLWQAAWRVAEGLPAGAEVATAKFWAADAGHRVAHTAVHIHGGMGIDMDHPLHRYFLAAKRNEFELGGATAQLLRLGALLAADSGPPLMTEPVVSGA